MTDGLIDAGDENFMKTSKDAQARSGAMLLTWNNRPGDMPCETKAPPISGPSRDPVRPTTCDQPTPVPRMAVG